jgi:hypothetical protein
MVVFEGLGALAPDQLTELKQAMLAQFKMDRKVSHTELLVAAQHLLLWGEGARGGGRNRNGKGGGGRGNPKKV